MIKSRKDLIAAAANTFFRLVSGPLSLILIPLYLTSEIQGFWYTFISLSALSVFADLGFSTIVLQFAAHEFSHLAFGKNRVLEGDEHCKHKLASLICFTMKCGILLTIVVFPIIFLVGWYLFASKTTAIFWIIPWGVYLIGASLSFLNSLLLSFIEGCDSVAQIHLIRLLTGLCTTALTLTLLVLHCGLFSLSFGMVAGQVVSSFLLLFHYRCFFRDLLASARDFYYPWRQEIFGLLKKYAVSWSFGYLIFQIYTPLTFHFHGAVAAGKVGISLTLWSAVFSISMIFITVVTPKLNMCISSKNWQSLDYVFGKSLKYTLLCFLMGSFVIFGILISGYQTHIVDRFLGLTGMISLFIMWFSQLFTSSWAVYIRGHKIEPLLLPTVVIATISAFITYLLAMYFDIQYLFFGYAFCSLFYIPTIIYIKKRVKMNYQNSDSHGKLLDKSQEVPY